MTDSLPVPVHVLLRASRLALAAVVTLPLWPIYALTWLIFGRSPATPSLARIVSVARGALREAPPAPGLSAATRALILLITLERAVLLPLRGLAWHLDELLYGRALDTVQVQAPIFELSAARSGSTQLARYLEDDPRLVAPTLLQTLFPFLWAWRLARALSPYVDAERLRARVRASVPADYLARHELDPLRTDTFEVAIQYLHLADLIAQLGPEPFVTQMSPAVLAEGNRPFWEADFLPTLDRIARKRLLLDPGKRLFIKGHFQAVAPLLAARYPDAHFLTVVRDPLLRLRSLINFHRSQPREAGFGPLPWEWILPRALAIELPYGEAEQTFYRAGERRHVVRFADYVRDLPGTLREVYAEVLGWPPPDALPDAHAHRDRAYTVDRSLTDLGLDPNTLAERLAAYQAWCAPRR